MTKPWIVDGSTVYSLNEKGTNHLYARVYVGNGAPAFAEEQESAARLMAAAPDMLAMLREKRDVFVGYRDHHLAKGDHDKASTNHQHVLDIDSMIEKASKQ